MITQAITQALMYRRTYSNYLNVIINSIRKKYPIKAILKNGKEVSLHDGFEAYMLSQCGRNLHDYNNEMITLCFGDKKVKLYGVNIDSEAIQVFLNNLYQWLPVKDKVVIDIGANIADTPIYFSLRGATKVIGIEPAPKNYELAIKNIQVNGLTNIEMKLAGCSDHKGFATVDPEQPSSAITQLKQVKNGVEIPLLTLEELEGTILKMDCEGCEHDIILFASENTLRRFSHMIIEYHYGYKNLVEKLEKCDFKTLVTKPTLTKDMQWGYIFAELN